MTSAEGSGRPSWETEQEKPVKSCFYQEFVCSTEGKVKAKPYPVGKE